MQRELFVDGHRLVALPLNTNATGEPVILLHGINLSPAFWRTDEVFVNYGPCYALSLPGHAPGAFPAGFSADQITPETIARVVAGAVRQLVGVTPATLAGISTGGFAALSVAAYEPGLVRRVVCISGFAEGHWHGVLRFYQIFARLGAVGRALFHAGMNRGRRSPADLREVFEYFVADRTAMAAYPRLAELVANVFPDWCSHDLDAMMLYYRAMPEINIGPQLPQISAPTLVMTGDRDPIISPDQALLLARSLPKADLEVLTGAGHLLSVERPAEYARILHNWLGRMR
ncbi:MAG TPA: alpha/beta hydrolase [Roseiflexaceae bacterium]|nr:alpha/beta hydrolase [Roseiflexaceae bacterium]